MTLISDARSLVETAHQEEGKALAVLSTAACARALGVSAQFIRGEIQDGRLSARVFKPETRRRAVYTITAEDFAAYVERYWPKAG